MINPEGFHNFQLFGADDGIPQGGSSEVDSINEFIADTELAMFFASIYSMPRVLLSSYMLINPDKLKLDNQGTFSMEEIYDGLFTRLSNIGIVDPEKIIQTKEHFYRTWRAEGNNPFIKNKEEDRIGIPKEFTEKITYYLESMLKYSKENHISFSIFLPKTQRNSSRLPSRYKIMKLLTEDTNQLGIINDNVIWTGEIIGERIKLDQRTVGFSLNQLAQAGFIKRHKRADYVSRIAYKANVDLVPEIILPSNDLQERFDITVDSEFAESIKKVLKTGYAYPLEEIAELIGYESIPKKDFIWTEMGRKIACILEYGIQQGYIDTSENPIVAIRDKIPFILLRNFILEVNGLQKGEFIKKNNTLKEIWSSNKVLIEILNLSEEIPDFRSEIKEYILHHSGVSLSELSSVFPALPEAIISNLLNGLDIHVLQQETEQIIIKEEVITGIAPQTKPVSDGVIQEVSDGVDLEMIEKLTKETLSPKLTIDTLYRSRMAELFQYLGIYNSEQFTLEFLNDGGCIIASINDANIPEAIEAHSYIDSDFGNSIDKISARFKSFVDNNPEYKPLLFYTDKKAKKRIIILSNKTEIQENTPGLEEVFQMLDVYVLQKLFEDMQVPLDEYKAVYNFLITSMLDLSKNKNNINVYRTVESVMEELYRRIAGARKPLTLSRLILQSERFDPKTWYSLLQLVSTGSVSKFEVGGESYWKVIPVILQEERISGESDENDPVWIITRDKLASYEKDLKRYLGYLAKKYNVLDGDIQNEILQELYIAVFINREKLQVMDNFLSWSIVVLKNKVFDFLIRKKDINFSDFESDEGENILLETVSDKADVQAIVEKNERVKSVHEAIARLSQKDQEVIQLIFFQNLRIEEVAERLNELVSTVRSRFYRAQDKLRGFLEDF